MMEWVKLLAVPAYYLDGALLRAGEPAEVLFCRALAYCGSVESAGVIDKTVLPMLVPRPEPRAAALVREGLWLDEGDQYRVRSWDKWQDAHDVAAHRRKLDRERQRKRRQDALSRDSDEDASRDSHVTDRVTVTRRHAVEGEGEREGDKTQLTTSVVAPSRRATRIPEDWPAAVDKDRLWQWALEHAPAVAIGPETANWQDWHRAKGDTAKDWNASWRTWMRRAQKDAESRRGGQQLALVRAPRPSTTDAAVAQTLALAAQLKEQGA